MLHAVSFQAPGARWFVALVLSSLLIRVILWKHYEVTYVADSKTYLRMARLFEEGDLREDDGGRTPGHPLLLMIAGHSPKRLWIFQMGLGVGTSSLLFLLCLVLTRSLALSFTVGLSHSLNLSQLFFEAMVASESLATFFVMATTASLAVAVSEDRPLSLLWTSTAFSGLSAAAAALTRPQYAYLPLAAMGLVFLSEARARKTLLPWKALPRALFAAAPGVLAITLWATLNYVWHDYLTLSTYMGINLTNHTIVSAESAPDRYREIASVLIRYREDKVRRTGRHSMAVWEALPELEEVTELTRPAISKQLGSLSKTLILRHPERYLLSTSHAWKDFWMVANYWAPDKLRPPSLRQLLARLWTVEMWALRLFNGFFLLAVVVGVLGWPPVVRRSMSLPLAAVVVVILGTSLVQALFEYGENPRYAVSVQSLAPLAVTALLYRSLGNGNRPPTRIATGDAAVSEGDV